MKLRSLIVATLIAAFAIGFVAMAQEPVTVEFWHRFSSGEPALQQLADWFEALNPNVTINLVYQGSYGSLQQKITGSVVATEVPTMSIFYEDWIPPVADALLPLGPYFTDEEVADILPALLYTDMVTIPFNKSIMVLYYIEDYIPVPPTTWQEFYDMSVAATVDEDDDGIIDRYGAGFRPASNPEQFLALLEQNGGSVLNKGWTEVTLGNAAGLEAANFYASLAPYSWVTSAYLNSNVGYVAMAIDTSGGYNYWKDAVAETDLTLKTAPLPVGVQPGSFIQGTNIGIFKDADPAAIEAGVAFLKFLLEPNNTGYWAGMTGYMPVTYSGLESAAWQVVVKNAEHVAASSEMMPYGVASLSHPNYGDMRAALSTMCEEIMLGAATVEEAVATAVAEIEALLDY